MADIAPAHAKKPRKKSPKKKTTTGKTPPPQSLTPPAPSTGGPPPVNSGATSTASPPGIDPAVLAGVVTLPFAIWARVADNDDLLLKEAESAALAGALAGVCDKYLPKAATAAGPEIALLMSLGMVIGPRLTLPKAPAKAPKVPAKAPKVSPPSNGTAQDATDKTEKTDSAAEWDAPPDTERPAEPGWVAPPDNGAARQ